MKKPSDFDIQVTLQCINSSALVNIDLITDVAKLHVSMLLSVF